VCQLHLPLSVLIVAVCTYRNTGKFLYIKFWFQICMIFDNSYFARKFSVLTFETF